MTARKPLQSYVDEAEAIGRAALIGRAREDLHAEHDYSDQALAERLGALEFYLAALLDVLDPAGGELDRLKTRWAIPLPNLAPGGSTL